MTNKKKKTNGSGKVQVSISLDDQLMDEIEHYASLDNRNRSNFIETSLRRLAQEGRLGEICKTEGPDVQLKAAQPSKPFKV